MSWTSRPSIHRCAHEIATICYVGFGRRPDYRTVERILAEEPTPLRMVSRFSLYHEMEEPQERRMAVVRLRAEGWNIKSIVSYLKTARSTVYRALRRWVEEGAEGLDDRPNTGGGVRKADLKAYAAARRIQKNPELGASYGPIRVSFTTRGDTSPASGLAVDRFPVANSVGFVKYERTFRVPPKVARKLGKFAIVQHGVDLNGNGRYDFGASGRSELDPSLPQEATIPANCGVITPMALGTYK